MTPEELNDAVSDLIIWITVGRNYNFYAEGTEERRLECARQMREDYCDYFGPYDFTAPESDCKAVYEEIEKLIEPFM